MPNYDFVCNNDMYPNDDIVTINMKMSEYTDKQYCETCVDKLYRTSDSLVCGYQCKCGRFYGKVFE